MPAPPVSKEALVNIDPAVMGERPVFVGTRVPIDIVLACIDAGDAAARLQATYPFLTLEHIAAAREWIECNGLTPRSRPALRETASENYSAPSDLRSLPLLFDNAFAQAAKLRRSRESVRQKEPGVRCEIYVQAKSGETILGSMSPPLGIPSSTFDVFSHWEGTEKQTMPTLLQTPKLKSPWDQRLKCIAAMAGESVMETFPSLAGGQWTNARLTMPDLDESVEKETVTVAIDTAAWVATLNSTSPAREVAELAVPCDLRQQSVCVLLVEMSSRLLLGRSGWAA
ncbi:DUF433 domain-containing protein [Variovorax sp. GT1P44]|uniref:DUF433 domain-containing protein n=1 Tax=Variovorax sp. GT1P44 TaxID=3443742 RepID=UPI003F47F2A9